jgi:hypothetical protein
MSYTKPDPYEVMDVYCLDQRAYFPVFRRPGRQRFGRQAFESHFMAYQYGQWVTARYIRIIRQQEKTMAQYSGAGWIEHEMHHGDADFKISPLGKAVADLLGELFQGIYHLDLGALHRVDWANDHHVSVSIGWKDWSTYDFNLLTKLVFLAHHMALRVELEPSRNQYVRLIFHQRKRTGNGWERHPTLREAVAAFEQSVSLPEYQD